MTRKHDLQERLRSGLQKTVLITLILLFALFPATLQGATAFVVYPDTLDLPGKRFSIVPFMKPARKTVGLALSGGGANGIAQIGVLKALEEAEVQIDYIAGTSMGAIIGGLYSSGYTPEELAVIAGSLSWESLLAIREESPRSRIFLEQQRIRDRATAAIRFDKLKLMVPKSLSSAQSLTETLDALVLNAVYHAWPDFGSLPIGFRAVATDLVSGKRISLASGPLSEAMRASSTVPVLFEPVERDGYRLVDGGLVANLPVDELDYFNTAYKIAVDTHGSMYSKSDDLDLPWKAADQAITILTALQYPAQLEKADMVIAPDLTDRIATDFSDIDALIETGYTTGRKLALTIKRDIQAGTQKDYRIENHKKTFSFINGQADVDGRYDALVSGIIDDEKLLSGAFEKLLATDLFSSVSALLDQNRKTVTFRLAPLPRIGNIVVTGGPEQPLTQQDIDRCFEPVINRLYTNRTGTTAIENLVRLFRKRGYSLVEPEAITLTGKTLTIVMTSGKADRIEIVRNRNGASLTPIRREIKVGTEKAVRLEKAEETTGNLYETGMFSRVSVSAERNPKSADSSGKALTFSLVEKPSSVLRLGIRYDETSNAQLLLDLRNENIGGDGASLGAWIKAGNNNTAANIEYYMPRIGSTHLTLFSKLFYEQREFDTRQLRFSESFDGYTDADVSTYGIQRYGISGAFGTRIRKNGRLSLDFTLQNAQSYQDAGPEHPDLRTGTMNLLSVGGSLTIDSRNSARMPTSGRYTNIGYTLAPVLFDNDEIFWQITAEHEENIPIGNALTLQISGAAGISGSYLPLSEQFFLGGPGNSGSRRFVGLKPYDLIGSNMATAGMQIAYRAPFEIIFPTSLTFSYNAGNVWHQRKEISLSRLIHGAGAGIVWNTPVGPARLSLSKAFAFLREEDDSQSSSLRFSDTVWYFSLGHDF